MYKKLCFLISFLLVFGMVGSAFAGSPPADACAVYNCEQGADPNILYDSINGWNGTFDQWNAGSWDVSDYMEGSGALDCGEDGLSIVADPRLISDVGDEFSLACWLKPEIDPEDSEGAIFQARDYYFTIAVTKDSMTMWGPDKDNSPCNAYFPNSDRGIWSHWTFVKDAVGLKIYRNGVKLAATVGTIPFGPYTSGNIAIGSEPGGDHAYEGKMDDVRIYHRALTSAEILAWTGDANVARDLSPNSSIIPVTTYDAMNVRPFTWTAGDNAGDVNGHDVYFGTDKEAVESRNSSVHIGRQTATEYDPCVLDFGMTYYWAIDEVNDVTTWPGMLRAFALGSYLDVDLMNSYNSENPPNDNWIFSTWEDGFVNGTGSQVGYLVQPFEERDETYEGDVSMPFDYNNSANPFYSEASALVSNDNITVGSDWTVGNPTALELWFYGADPNNAPETLYMGLRSSSSSVVTVDYSGDTADVNQPEWHRFIVPLADFNAGGVDLTDVQEIYIGAGDRTSPSEGGDGLLFIDTIRLYPPRCLRDITGIALDWNDDCIVDSKELEVFSAAWLEQDMMASPSAGLWLKLDDTNTVPENGEVLIEDSSEFADHAGISLYDGNEPNAVIWADGYCAADVNGALDMNVSNNVIAVTNLPDVIRNAKAMTITFWFYHYVDDDDVDNPYWESGAWVEGLEGDHPGGWTLWAIDWDYGDCIRIWDEEDDDMWCGGDWSVNEYNNQWVHFAFVLSPEATMVYLNGELNGTGDPFGTRSGWQIEAGPGGNGALSTIRFGYHTKWAPDWMPHLGQAKFDDIRIYDNVLNEASIQSIMDCSEGSIDSFYVPLINIANIVPKVGDEGVYNPSNIDSVNFIDYAVFAESWLVSSPPLP